MKFQNPSLNSVLTGRTDERTDERTSRNQYAPHFFKVGGIKTLHKLGKCLHTLFNRLSQASSHFLGGTFYQQI